MSGAPFFRFCAQKEAGRQLELRERGLENAVQPGERGRWHKTFEDTEAKG